MVHCTIFPLNTLKAPFACSLPQYTLHSFVASESLSKPEMDSVRSCVPTCGSATTSNTLTTFQTPKSPQGTQNTADNSASREHDVSADSLQRHTRLILPIRKRHKNLPHCKRHKFKMAFFPVKPEVTPDSNAEELIRVAEALVSISGMEVELRSFSDSLLNAPEADVRVTGLEHVVQNRVSQGTQVLSSSASATIRPTPPPQRYSRRLRGFNP